MAWARSRGGGPPWRGILCVCLCAVRVRVLSACEGGCAPAPLGDGFVRRVGARLVDEGNRTFRFASINAPNIHRVEIEPVSGECSDGECSIDEYVRAPSEYEIRDTLCSIRQMGATVTRVYTFSYGEGPGFHVDSGGVLNEAWFLTFDRVLAIARDMGVRLIVPLINTQWTWQWGSVSVYGDWANDTEHSFFRSRSQRAMFKATIELILSRRNSLTGRRYADDSAILAWEIGNELTDDELDGFPVALEWTQDIARHIRKLDRNHLLIDGGFFSTEVLAVADIDIVGSTYYGTQYLKVSEDAELLEAFNDVTAPARQKLFMVKEFGFVEPKPGIPAQNMDFVKGVLDVVQSHESICGALFWSLRPHDKSGGFQQHAEFGGHVRALHWPGFSQGPPNYEVEVFDALQLASLNLSGQRASNSSLWATGSTAPCAPSILRIEAGTGCLTISFAGSAGAVRYEILAAIENDVPEVLFRNVTDNHTGAVNISSYQLGGAFDLFRYHQAGRYSFTFCVKACSSVLSVNHSCSACSATEELVWDVSDTDTENKCVIEYTTEWENDEYLYTIDLKFPGASPSIVAMCAGLAISLTVMLSRMFPGPPPAVEVIKLLQVPSAGRAHALDGLRLLASLHIVLHVAHKGEWFSGMPGLMERFAEWGAVWYPYVFLHCGFVCAVRYSGVADRLDVWPLVSRRWARGYPVILAYSLLDAVGRSLSTGITLPGKLIYMLPFCVHAWMPESQVQTFAVGNSWLAGPLLLFTALGLPLTSRLHKCSSSAVATILAVAFAATLHEAMYFAGTSVHDAVTWITAYSHGASFVAGVALGVLFKRSYPCEAEQLAQEPERDSGVGQSLLWFLERCGASFSIVCLSALFVAADLHELTSWELLHQWLLRGALVPTQALLLWSVAAGSDFLGCFFGRACSCLGWVSPWLWMHALMAAPLAQLLTSPWNTSALGYQLAIFSGILLAIAYIGEACIQRPVEAWVVRAMPTPKSFGLVPLQASFGRRESIVLYYCGMLATSWLCLMGPRPHVLAIPDGPAAAVLRAGTWLLFVPLGAFSMSLAGLVLYPPVSEEAPKPAKAQVQTARLKGEAHFKIVFRIVTRGGNPSLVKDNVLSLLSILDGCLSQDRWALEVVTDNPLGLAKLGTSAKEILVPSAYTPPRGCRYKARALQYAVLASTAGRMDWIVHLDEETTFDSDTVAHILTHCRAQNAAVQRGAQCYGHTGQGVIVYNVKEQVNLVCCLADSIRVADDLGKFALQYRLFQEPLIGMHGSFVVCSNAVEMDVGFDWGIPGSITEDTFFALKCAEIGVQVVHCGGYMYEQSPFCVHDFAKQRCRWFSGIWLCVRAPNLPLLHRAFLGGHTLAWGASPFVVLASWVNVLCDVQQPDWVNTSVRLLYAFPLGCYVLGFLFTYRPSELRHGIVEYLMLLFLQITCIPIFAIMEAYGIALALWTQPFTKFELVQKETGEVRTSTLPLVEPVDDKHEALLTEEKTTVISTTSSSSPDESETTLEQPPEARSRPGHLHENWARLFADAPSEVHVPQVLRPRSGGEPCENCIKFPRSTLHMIRQLAPREHAPLDTLDVVATALGTVISHVSNEDVFILGVETPTSASEGKAPILPVRVHMRHDASFLACAADVRGERAASSDLHQASGFPPLATTLLHGGESWNVRALSDAPFQFAIVSGRRENHPERIASVLLMVVGDELLFSYRADFLTTCAAEIWVRRFVQVLQAASSTPSACLHQLPLVTEDELHAVADRAGKARPYNPFTLHEQFLAESKRSPAKVAVVCGGEEVTYADLRVAALKVALGITTVLGEVCQENLLIGMLFERSVDVAAVILGVLFSGCGYLPIDTRFPPLRIQDILLDAGASCPMVLVGNQEFAFSLPLDYPGQVVCASRGGLQVPAGAVAGSPQMRIASPQSLIYCMYTSGTTGKPKGVMVEHGSLSMRISWFQRQFSLGAEDTVLFKTQYTFGISEWEIFWPLTTGATMLVAPREIVESLPELVKLIEVSRCTHAFFVPSHLTALLRHWRQVEGVESHARRDSLRWVVACGEALPRQVVRDFNYVLPQASIYNLYGPTEGSMTWTCCDHDDPSVDAGIPLGKPIDNTVVVLLDRWQRPVPDGVPGEICFGHCLARGYLNRPDLTAERFVANPLPAGWLPADGLPCPRLYRTGDMAIWMDGELHFAGRVDRQIKFRGFRIELGAVEAAMREAFQVAIAQEVPWLCCLLVPPSARRPGGELVAFLQSSLSDSEVQVMLPELSARLPPYMVPTKITSMPNLPTLPSGKVDMRALQSEASGDGAGPDPMQQNPAVEEARDSLGQVRQFTAAHSTSLRVADNLRAFFMYGVVLDHFYGCTDSSRCRLLMDALIFPRDAGSPGALSEVLRSVEVLFRSAGNYKTMSGFMMISAYADARYTDAAHFGKTDVVMLLAYLQMMWIMDPIYLSFCTDEHVCMPSGHRWYLLAVLMIKALLVLFRLARLPPLAQCVAVTVVAFTMPPVAGCVVETDREDRCWGSNDNDTWTAYYPFFDAVWTIFIRGGPEGETVSPIIISRHYLLFAMQYFWTFYYGHYCVQMFYGFVDELPRRIARVTRWCSFVGFLLIELILTGAVGPSLYSTMQGMVAGSFDPPLLGNLGLFAALSASVMLLAYAISGVQTRLQTLGSTTLGCYIAHWYVVPLVPYFERQISSMNSLGYLGLTFQVPLLMLLPLVVQLSVGVAFHRFLMLEVQVVFRAYNALLTWAGCARTWALSRARWLRGQAGLRAWSKSPSAIPYTRAGAKSWSEDETDPEEMPALQQLPCSMSRVLL